VNTQKKKETDFKKGGLEHAGRGRKEQGAERKKKGKGLRS